MDKVFLDTNFLMDVAVEHRPQADDAARLFEAIADGRAMGVISPASLKDFYYVARRGLDDATRREWIALFVDAFIVADLGRDACLRALVSDEADFEDGIVRALAEMESCDAIVSRDIGAFSTSRVPRMTAGEYLERIGA